MGSLQVGSSVLVMPLGEKATVKSIARHGGVNSAQADPGDYLDAVVLTHVLPEAVWDETCLNIMN